MSADRVRAQVKKFWDLFSAKNKSGFAQLYAPTASVFAADARRSESARLMLVRRERELFAPGSSVQASCGAITVQVLSANVAVASYPLHFSLTRIVPNGSTVQVDVPFARVTQVFQRNDSGELVIIHEHMSSSEPTTPRTLQAKAASSS